MNEWSPHLIPYNSSILENISFLPNQQIEKNLHTLILGETTRLKQMINIEGLTTLIKVDSILLKDFLQNILSEKNGNVQLKTAHKMLETLAHIGLLNNNNWEEDFRKEISLLLSTHKKQEFNANASFLNKDEELLEQYNQLLSFQTYNQTVYSIKPLNELFNLNNIINSKNKEFESLERLTTRSENQNKRIESLKQEILILTDPNFFKYISRGSPSEFQNYIKSFKSHYAKQIRKAIHSQLISAQLEFLNNFFSSSCNKKLINILGYSPPSGKLSPDLINAILFYGKLQKESSKANSQSYSNNIEYLSQLIKDSFDKNNSTWVFTNTKAQEWKKQIQEAFPNADIAKWRNSYSFKINNLEFTVEIDPLKYVQMGNLMKNPYSCLHLFGGNFASAVSNAIDCNKALVWVKNKEGKIIGRKLIVLTDEGIIRYKTYYAENGFDLDQKFDLSILHYAKHIGVPISTAETERGWGPGIEIMMGIFDRETKIEIPKILSDYWLDDGSITEPINIHQDSDNTLKNLSNNTEAGYFILSGGFNPQIPPILKAAWNNRPEFLRFTDQNGKYLPTAQRLWNGLTQRTEPQQTEDTNKQIQVTQERPVIIEDAVEHSIEFNGQEINYFIETKQGTNGSIIKYLKPKNIDWKSLDNYAKGNLVKALIKEASEQGLKLNLADANLTNAELYGVNLAGADLTNVDLQKATLQSANLSHCNLKNANLQSATLVYINLSDANLNGVDLRDTSLTRANLTNVDLYGANLSSTDLSFANLKNARFDSLPEGFQAKNEELKSLTKNQILEFLRKRKYGGSTIDLSNLDLHGLNLSGLNLENANLTNTNLQEANLKKSNLEKADLSGANLKYADLRETYLQNTTAVRANFEGSLVNGYTRFNGSNLLRANLSRLQERKEGNTISISFSSANLTEANLSYVNTNSLWMEKANLQNAKLIGANLCGLNHSLKFRGVFNLNTIDLTDALYDESTKLPEGINLSLSHKIDKDKVDLTNVDLIALSRELSKIPSGKGIQFPAQLSKYISLTNEEAIKEFFKNCAENESTYAVYKEILASISDVEELKIAINILVNEAENGDESIISQLETLYNLNIENNKKNPQFPLLKQAINETIHPLTNSLKVSNKNQRKNLLSALKIREC